MKKNKKGKKVLDNLKNKKLNNVNICIYVISLLLSIMFLILLIKHKINANFYCDTYSYTKLCDNNISSFNLFIAMFVISLISIIIGIIRLSKNKKKKIILSIIPIIIVIVTISLTIITYNKIFESKLLKENDVKKIELYYKNKKKTKKLYSVYENKMDNLIKDNNVKEAIKYLESYMKLNNDETKIKEYKYKIALLIIDNIDYYDKGIQYFNDLKDYKDVSDKKKELMYNYVTNISVTSNNYDDVKGILSQLNDYKDSKEKLQEIKYNYAKDLIDSNESQKAMNIYKELGNYKDSQEQYNNLYNIHKFDGYWSGEEKIDNWYIGFYTWIVDGTTCYNVYDTKTQKNAHDKYECKIENDNLIIYRKISKDEPMYTFNNVNGNLVTSYDKYGTGRVYTLTLSKKSDDTTLPTSKTIREPSIGMTAEEVKASTWGSPNKINKDTYSWGTTEQWVYDNYKYIYFKNGKVTSISE